MSLCKYCENEFTLIRNPRLMPCEHTFCLDCLEYLYKSNYRRCPIDHVGFRKPTELPVNVLALRRRVNWCKKHLKPLNFFTTNTLSKVCDDCIDLQNISKSSLILSSEITNYVNTFVQNLREKSESIENYLNETKISLDTLRSLMQAYEQLIYLKDIDINDYQTNQSQLKLVASFDITFFENLEVSISSEDIFIFNKALFEFCLMKYQQVQANSNRTYIWVAQSLTKYAIGPNLQCSDSFIFQSSQNMELKSIGIGAPLFNDIPLYVNTLAIQELDYRIMLCNLDLNRRVSKNPGDIIFEVILDSTILLVPGVAYTFTASFDCEQICYSAISTKQNVNVGSNITIERVNPSAESSVFFYFSFKK